MAARFSCLAGLLFNYRRTNHMLKILNYLKSEFLDGYNQGFEDALNS